MVTQRLKASKLRLTIRDEDYWSEVSSALLTHDVEFALGQWPPPQMEIGWRLEIVAVQSLTIGSLWRLMWDSPNMIVPFRLAPAGNEIPSQNEPHFAGELRLGTRPPLGGESSVKTSHLFEAVLNLVGEPQTITEGEKDG